MAKVVFTNPAKFDLLDIEHYIFTELKNPQAANRIIDGILNVAQSLRTNPQRHSLLNDKILKQVGLRIVPFNNYNIFYRYDAKSDLIYIIRILYNRVDWKNIL